MDSFQMVCEPVRNLVRIGQRVNKRSARFDPRLEWVRQSEIHPSFSIQAIEFMSGWGGWVISISVLSIPLESFTIPESIA
jgi:hypothetical protein